MRRTVLLLAVTLASVALGRGGTAGADTTAASLGWRVDESPFRLTILADGKPLLRQRTGQAGPGARLSYRVREGGAMQTLTALLGTRQTAKATVYTVATSEPDRTATVTVARTSRGIHVGLDLSTASTNVRTVYESFDSVASEHFLGTGERRDFVDLRGQIVPIKVWHECGMAKPAPFFLSSRGYGIQFTTTAVGRMAFGLVAEGSQCQLGTAPCEIRSHAAAVQACFKTGSLSYEIYTGTPEQIVHAYAASTGRPPLPEPEQFALMKWRDTIRSDTELTEDVDRFAAASIPLGWVIVDNPWESGACAGSMTFDTGLFPDPLRTIASLHARGVRVMMWVSPMVRTVCGRDYYPRDRVIGTAKYQAIDLTDPAVAATFEQRLRDLLATGVDGFKVDRGDEVDLELRTLASGSGNDVHNAYPLLVAQSVVRAAQAARGKSLPTLFRAGYAGSQRTVTGTWSGDLPGDWNGIENAIRSAQTAGLVGYSTWGSDVGGYFSPSLKADVFVRWSQLGAVSPVFEVGGDGLNATPWLLGDKAMAGLQKAAVLHYELFPYHYQLAREASATGISILRPLALHYPGDERSWAAEYELLVGADLLAAPLTVPGTNARVYLPPGDWVDLGTGATLTGPISLTRPTPLDELPLYLRAGAAIPYNLRSPDVWRSPWQLQRPLPGGARRLAGGAGAGGRDGRLGRLRLPPGGPPGQRVAHRARPGSEGNPVGPARHTPADARHHRRQDSGTLRFGGGSAHGETGLARQARRSRRHRPQARAPQRALDRRSGVLGLARLGRDRNRKLLGERLEGTAGVRCQAQIREEPGHDHALPEVSEAWVWSLAPRERERELRVAASRGEGKREGSAEAGIDVGDRQGAVRLAEALDVRGPDDADRLGHPRAVGDQLGIHERHALDRLAALRLDHRAGDRVETAPVEVAEDVDRVLLAEAQLLHHRLDRRVAEEEGELAGVVRTVDVPRAEALAYLHEQGIAGVVRYVVRQPRARAVDAVRLEEQVRQVLVAHRRADLGRRCEHDCRRERFPTRREDPLIEIGQRDDETDVVCGDEPGEGGDVPGVVDARHQRLVIGVVERRRERIDVGRDGGGARPPERGDDVDALAGAREENGGHGVGA